MRSMQDAASVNPEDDGYQIDPEGSEQKAEMCGNQELVLNPAGEVVEEIKKRLEVLEHEANAMMDEYSEMKKLIDEAYRELHRYYYGLVSNEHIISVKPCTETLHHTFCKVIKCLSHETTRKACNIGAFADAALQTKGEPGVGLVQIHCKHC